MDNVETNEILNNDEITRAYDANKHSGSVMQTIFLSI